MTAKIDITSTNIGNALSTAALLLKEGISKVLENDLPLVKDGITPEGKTFHWFFRNPYQYLCKKHAFPPFLNFSGKKNVTPLIKIVLNGKEW